MEVIPYGASHTIGKSKDSSTWDRRRAARTAALLCVYGARSLLGGTAAGIAALYARHTLGYPHAAPRTLHICLMREIHHDSVSILGMIFVDEICTTQKALCIVYACEVET
jgi:hypothetical protein